MKAALIIFQQKTARVIGKLVHSDMYSENESVKMLCEKHDVLLDMSHCRSIVSVLVCILSFFFQGGEALSSNTPFILTLNLLCGIENQF
jgi:hypothetical protein